SAERDCPGLDVANASQRLDQFGLPVALDSREGDDLTGVDVEGHAVHRRQTAVVAYDEVANLHHRVARSAGLLFYGQDHVAAHHHRRQLGLRVAGLGHPHDPALADHRDDVGDLAYLAQLVRDEEDRLSRLLQGAHDV